LSDVGSTGTMPGCCGLELDRWIRPGQTIELEIDGIGTLRNTITAEQFHTEPVAELTPELIELFDSNRLGTLATIRADGLPHQSTVYFARRHDRLLVSTLRERAKVRDIEQQGWASLCVRGSEPPLFSATFSGEAVVRVQDIGEATAFVMQRIAGSPEPPEAQTDKALAAAGRVLIEMRIARVAATSHLWIRPPGKLGGSRLTVSPRRTGIAKAKSFSNPRVVARDESGPPL
jgi:Pyridoxamine 5'-phosphate oxidase/Fumarylacetoacetate (FAA) hydrolase family